MLFALWIQASFWQPGTDSSTVDAYVKMHRQASGKLELTIKDRIGKLLATQNLQQYCRSLGKLLASRNWQQQKYRQASGKPELTTIEV
jgi:hypothetical protein